MACLDELGAQERVGNETKPIDELRDHPETLTDSSFRMFATAFGELDIVAHPAGFSRGYDDLIERSVIVTIQDGDDLNSVVVEAPVVSVGDVYESKRQAGRRKDIEALPAFTGIHPANPKEVSAARTEDVARRLR